MSFQINAQNLTRGIVPSVALKNCQVDQWTGENGLVSNNLTSVSQSDDGFLWMTTNNGIMRFDGNHLDVFDKTTVPVFVTDGFVKVYDHRGVLYFATRGNGIVKFEEGAFNQFLPNDTILPKSTRSILFSKSGKIYVGTDTKGVFVIDNEKVSPTPWFSDFQLHDYFFGGSCRWLIVDRHRRQRPFSLST